ncbi:MAG TPA: hypothetical protein VMZ06_03175 [Candidatus Bathyarchaeia archaeon]|nr:hypothetical protein [Candidatus Bathyarchaeia archaeon]
MAFLVAPEGFDAGKMEAAGSSTGADLAFAARAGEDLKVEVRVGISYVSIANARANLEAEAAGRDFDALAKKASDTWEGRRVCSADRQGDAEDRGGELWGGEYVCAGGVAERQAGGADVGHA